MSVAFHFFVAQVFFVSLNLESARIAVKHQVLRNEVCPRRRDVAMADVSRQVAALDVQIGNLLDHVVVLYELVVLLLVVGQRVLKEFAA